jgi:hypothetical protein
MMAQKPWFQLLRRWYTTCAVLILNIIILLLTINIVLYGIYYVVDSIYPEGKPEKLTGIYGLIENQPLIRTIRSSVEALEKYRFKTGLLNKYDKEWDKNNLKKVYPEWTKEDYLILMNETWGRTYQYQPFTQVTEAPYQGKFVNVDIKGFRWGENQTPWPPKEENFVIFVQKKLRSNSCKQIVDIYNFGRGGYYSSQERALLEELIIEGYKADLSIFIDGLNDFHNWRGEPTFTPMFTEFLAKSGPGNNPKPISSPQNIPAFDDPESLRLVVDRLLTNQKLIEAVASQVDMKVLFVWQPSPTYKYNLEYHPYKQDLPEKFGDHIRSKYGYVLLEEKARRLEGLADGNLLWLGNIQENEHLPLYVDTVHYSARFSEEIAERIVQAILKLNLICAK